MTFEIITGRFLDLAGEVLAVGYSGGNCGSVPEAVNNPAYMMIPNVGPIPVGLYFIGAPQDTVTQGPYVLPLSPDPSNQMFGRSGFLIHGDSVIFPGKKAASDGCIILSRDVREQIWKSGDRELNVVLGGNQ